MARSTAGAAPDFYEELGRRVAQFRKARSMSQERLGEQADVGVSYVAHIEVGSRRPTLEVLLRLADALSVPLWRLLTDDRLSHDELAWEGAARDLGVKLRGLTRDDLIALGYIAERMHATPRLAYVAHAAEPRLPRLRASPVARTVKKPR